MAPDSIIVQFVGSLLLALLTGSPTPLSADRLVSADLPAPVVFAAAWPGPGATGDRVDQLIVLDDGSVRIGGTSSIMSPPRDGDDGTAD